MRVEWLRNICCECSGRQRSRQPKKSLREHPDVDITEYCVDHPLRLLRWQMAVLDPRVVKWWVLQLSVPHVQDVR